ncbi:MAG: CdaR family protein, partial [Chloroflexota bacterium]
MWRWVRTNFRTFLWAFALAIAVWVAAVTSADPDETRVLPSAVPIEVVGQDPGLVLGSTIPKSVQLNLRAPRSVWDNLEANPENIRAVLDLSGLSEGEHTQELQIQIAARPVQIVAATPESVTLTLEPLATRTLTVDLTMSGEPAVGYQVGDATLDPKQVIVAGARSQVEKVARARLSLSLEGIRESIDESMLVEILDDQGQPITGLSVSPEALHVTLLVNQQGGYRDMAVKVVATGQVASGYRLTNI